MTLSFIHSFLSLFFPPSPLPHQLGGLGDTDMMMDKELNWTVWPLLAHSSLSERTFHIKAFCYSDIHPSPTHSGVIIIKNIYVMIFNKNIHKALYRK